MLEHWIWLAARPGVSDREKAILLRHFHDPEEIFRASVDDLAAVEGLKPSSLVALKNQDLSETEKILAQCKDKQIQILTYDAYPERLRQISDPPVILYYKGTLPDFECSPTVAIVGTRKASVYGLQTAKKMGYQIGSGGGLVVSGMAYGVDAMAMEGALLGGSPVVGILGCGVDVVYPKSNQKLYESILREGCVLSEFPPETPPVYWNFPKRNRIISALALGVLVVEAPEKSGALITARAAAEQGRDVFVVPGNVDIPTFKGSNGLLREGAIAVTCGSDVLSEYAERYPDLESRTCVHSGYSGEMPEISQKVAQIPVRPKQKTEKSAPCDKKDIDKGVSSPYSDLDNNHPAVSEREQQILELLYEKDGMVDDIVAEAGMTPGEALGIITMLEVKGLVCALPGGRLAAKNKSR